MCACHHYFWRHWRNAGLEGLSMNQLAFPQSDKVSTSISIANSQGMTLRDYFAAKAMVAIRTTKPATNDENLAINAYQMADAMLKARKA
jgi:hypothetical protein